MGTYKGLKTLQTFAPNWNTPELLEKTLIGRRELVDRLEELVIDGARGGPLHQRVIIGPRGSGKTHVMRVLHNRLWPNDEARRSLLVIYLLEDELGVASFLDFLVRLLKAIIRWYPEHAGLAQALEEIPELPSQTREHRALRLLLDTIGKGRAIILMENLGVTFDRKMGFGKRGQQALRDLLQQNRRIMIFAASQALVEGLRDRNAPFHGFFHVTHLRRLNREESLGLLIAIAEAYENADAIKFLRSPEGRGRMFAVYDFTGGNHRLLVTFYDFLVAESLAKLSKVFMEALNPLRPYYQEQMRSLSSQQQKIVQYLSLERDPRTVKQIARGCLASPNSVSSQLKDLLNRNLVSRNPRGRESCYEVTEALFRIVYQADLEQEGAPVRLFIDFLGNFYTAEELVRRARGYSLLGARYGNAKGVPFLDEARLYKEALNRHYAKEYSTITAKTPTNSDGDAFLSFFQELREARAFRDILEFSRCLGDEKDAFVLHTEADAKFNLGALDEAVASARKALEKEPGDAEAHMVLGKVLITDDLTHQEGISHALRAVELASDNPKIIEEVGITFGNAHEYPHALEVTNLLTKLRPDYSYGWLLGGLALQNLDRLEEAERSYRKALELDVNDAHVRVHLGVLLRNEGKHAEALEHFEAMTRLNPKDSNGWRFVGSVLAMLDRLEEAERSYRKALELDAYDVYAHMFLGVLLRNERKHAEALEHFEAMIRLRPEDSDGWRLAGRALAKLDRLEEAECSYRKALELDANDVLAHEYLGGLLNNAGKYTEALEHGEALTRLRPEDSDGWRLAGRALAKLDRLEEAERSYRKALELDANDAPAHEYLGVLLGKTGKFTEALEHLEIITKLCSDCPVGWSLAGRALQHLDRLEEAERSYRKALELDTNDAQTHENLSRLLGNVGKYGEALEHSEEVTRLRPEDPAGWRLAGLALQDLDRLEEAERNYRKALELDANDALAHEFLGDLLNDAGKYTEALEHGETLTRLRPGDPDGWRLMGLTLEMLYRLEEAERSYRKALELDANDALAHEYLGDLLNDAGKYTEALEHGEALTRLRPEDPDGWGLAGLALQHLDRLEEAERSYRKAVELEPDNSLSLSRLASLLESMGRNSESEKAFEVALAHSADPAEIYNSRGEMRRLRGDYIAALSDYEAAIATNEAQLFPRFNLISAYLGLGDIRSAQRSIHAAVQAAKVHKAERGLVVESIKENCLALFEFVPSVDWASFLDSYLMALQGADLLSCFDQALSLTVFALLKSHEQFSKDRLEEVIEHLHSDVGPWVNVQVAIRFIRVGIAYFKDTERTAVLSLAREERQLFARVLGIEIE